MNITRTRLAQTGLAVLAVATVTTALAAPVHARDGRARDVTSHQGRTQNPTCRGQEATHVNEDGTGSDDVIVVTDPTLDVHAWAGNDLVCVDTGDASYGATIYGDQGRDTIITYSGFNSVYGGPDGDSILSNSADHLLDGEEGSDTIYSGSAPDGIIYGGSENDRIMGSPGADYVHAGGGADLVMGFGGGDELNGGDGPDRLVGGDGDDDLFGGGDDDECVDVAGTNFDSCESEIVIIGGGGGGIALAP